MCLTTRKWAICLANQSLLSETLAIWRAEYMDDSPFYALRQLQLSGLWDSSLRFIVEHNCRFDEHLQYYAYAEDLDFSYGVYQHADKCGKKCIFSNRLIVNHNVSTEYRTPTRKATFMNYLHRYYICKKYKLSTVKFWWSNIGDFLFRLLKKESLFDYFRAISFLICNRKDISKGNFWYEKFM